MAPKKAAKKAEKKAKASKPDLTKVTKLKLSSAYGKLAEDPVKDEEKKDAETEEEKGLGGPRISKGSSSGEYGTPKEFMRACEKKFGRIVFDLAANASNTRVPDNFFDEAKDSLVQDWVALYLLFHGYFWLNPPFGNIGLWATKCAASASGLKDGILFLVPSSTGAKWFRDNIFKKADVYFLYGRITFEGQTTPYPKDCMLVHFHANQTGLIEMWDWRKDSIEEQAAA